MNIKTFAPTFFAVAAAALISAPVAGATAVDCEDDGPASVCSRNGHTAIYAEPRQAGSNFLIAPGGNPFGGGPMPPLLAID